MRIFDNVLHSHDSFSIKIGILDIFVKKRLDYMLCCLIPVVFDQIINDEFVDIEQMSQLE